MIKLLKYIAAVFIALYWAIEDGYYKLRDWLLGKKYSFLAALLILNGCSVQTPSSYQPVTKEIDITLNGESHECVDGYYDAVYYLRSLGIRTNDVPNGMVVNCYPPISGVGGIIHSVVGLAGMADYEGGNTSLVMKSCCPEYNTKLFLHEIAHLMGAGHSLSGIMFFETTLMHLATGYSNATLRELGL